MIELRTEAPEATLELGRWIGRRLPDEAMVGLDGDLGSGKTWMAKGLVRGLGDFRQELVKSPAFNLVHEYRLSRRLSVYHIDFYRLDEMSDGDALLFAEYLEQPGAICLVEWAEKFLAQLVPSYLSIRLSLVPGASDTCRDLGVTVLGATDLYDPLLAELEHHAYTRR